MIEEIVVPLIDLLRHRHDHVFQIEQITRKTQMLNLPGRVTRQIAVYVELQNEIRAASYHFDRAVAQEFKKALGPRGIPFTTNPTRGAWQMKYVGAHWLTPGFNVERELYSVQVDAKQGPGAPYALMGGGAPAYVFYIYEDEVQTHPGALRMIAHQLRQDLAEDSRPREITNLTVKIEREREKLLRRLAKV